MKKIKAVYDCSFSWLGTGISIKSDRDKLVSWAQKTSSSDCWWPQDDNEHAKYDSPRHHQEHNNAWCRQRNISHLH
jgi:hypothetical protein